MLGLNVIFETNEAKNSISIRIDIYCCLHVNGIGLVDILIDNLQ